MRRIKGRSDEVVKEDLSRAVTLTNDKANGKRKKGADKLGEV